MTTSSPRTTTLRPQTDAEYDVWLAAIIPTYAADKVASGVWSADDAVEKSRQEYATLLPQGRQTPGHHHYAIIGADGQPVGSLWIAEAQRPGKRVAYVYDVTIAPDHRRQGHALRAFQALEGEVARLGLAGIALHVFGHNTAAQALYAKLGFQPTNINLYKAVPPAA